MFRTLFRGPRTIRVPYDRANVDIQTVNVTQQSKSSPAVVRFLLTGAVMFLTLRGMRYLDPLGQHEKNDPLQERLEKAKKEAGLDRTSQYGKHWDEQHAMMGNETKSKLDPSIRPSDLVQLTLPIWIRKRAAQKYCAHDPSFKEFQKLQADQKRMSDLKKQIAASVMHSVTRSGRNNLELSMIGFQGKVECSLDIVPPVYPPPIYQVPCVWLSANSLPEYGWRTLPPDTGARIERVFRPLVLLDAATAASRVFIYSTYAITKAKLNEAFGSGKETSPFGRQQIVMPHIPQLSEKESSLSSSSKVSKSPTTAFPFLPDLSDIKGTRKLHQDVVSAMPYSLAIKQAAVVFKHVKEIRQRAAVALHVRGACQIRGFVQFVGDTGKFRIEVAAWYLPADNVFLGGVQVKESYVIPDYTAFQRAHEKMEETRKAELERRKRHRLQALPSHDAEAAKPVDEVPSPTDDESNK